VKENSSKSLNHGAREKDLTTEIAELTEEEKKEKWNLKSVGIME